VALAANVAVHAHEVAAFWAGNHREADQIQGMLRQCTLPNIQREQASLVTPVDRFVRVVVGACLSHDGRKGLEQERMKPVPDKIHEVLVTSKTQ